MDGADKGVGYDGNAERVPHARRNELGLVIPPLPLPFVGERYGENGKGCEGKRNAAEIALREFRERRGGGVRMAEFQTLDERADARIMVVGCRAENVGEVRVAYFRVPRQTRETPPASEICFAENCILA